jgi:hypothetical protein
LAVQVGFLSRRRQRFDVATHLASMELAARTTTTLVAVLAAFAVAAPTAHPSAMSVIRDCSEDGVLDGKYSPKELDGALEQLPSDLDEYTDCRAVIRRAQLGSAGDKHRGAKRPAVADRVDAAAPPTPGEQGAIAKASKADDPVRIGGRGVRPGESGAPFDAAGFGTDLPPLVLIVLIALAGSTLAGAAVTARRRFGASAAAAGPGGILRRLGEGVRRGVTRFRR